MRADRGGSVTKENELTAERSQAVALSKCISESHRMFRPRFLIVELAATILELADAGSHLYSESIREQAI